jgi:hypothetical protein
MMLEYYHRRLELVATEAFSAMTAVNTSKIIPPRRADNFERLGH